MSSSHSMKFCLACLTVVAMVTDTVSNDLPLNTPDIPLDENLQELKSWLPLGCTRSDYLKYGGCDREDWAESRSDCFKIAEIINRNMQIPLDSQDSLFAEEGPDPCLGDDQLFYGDQRRSLLEYLERLAAERSSNQSGDGQESHGESGHGAESHDQNPGETPSRDKRSTHREKRNSKLVRDYNPFNTNRWSMPIKYKLDGFLAAYGNGPIKDAIRLWEENTCVRFQQVDVDEELNEQHVVFLPTTSPVCYSYIGKADTKEEDMSQPIFLSRLCMTDGVLAHEIGHTLGLIHEHQRPDRDQYVQIISRNVKSTNHALFASIPTKFIDTRDIPYDFSSAMHYTSTAFSVNGYYTIQTKDRRFQRTIGQRVELSFWDALSINTAYCSDTCKGVFLFRKCSNHGYQDPNDCTRCRCPDGWTGDLCDYPAEYVTEPCGGVIQLNDGNKRYIESPNYGRGPYQSGQECTWLVEAPVGKRVIGRFEGPFNVACFDKCRHWVEVRSEEDLGLNGPRYCCGTTPSEVIVSNRTRMLINFRARDMDITRNGEQNGFRMSFVADGDECNPSPCWNSGTCVDLVGNFSCLCKPNNFGRHCEHHDLIECASNPCLNGGTCLEGFGRFTCECPYPYQGYRCHHGPPPLPPHLRTTSTPTSSTTEPTTTSSTTTRSTTTRSTTTTTTTTTSPTTASSTTTTPLRLTDPPVYERISPENILDLVFILDVSGPDAKQFGCLKGYIKSVIRRFQYGVDATRVGLMTLARFAHTELHLGSHSQRDGVLDDISSQNATSQTTTDYYNAIWLLLQQTFQVTNGARDDVPHVVVLVTYNKPSDQHLIVYKSTKRDYIQRLRDQNIQMLAVGVGDDINTEELLTITGSESHYYHPSNCQQLLAENSVDRLTDMIRVAAYESRQRVQTEQPTSPTPPTSPSTTPSTSLPSSVRQSSQPVRTQPSSGILTEILHTKPANRHQDTTPQETSPTSLSTTQGPPTTTPENNGPRCDWRQRTNCSDTCGGCGRRMMIYVCEASDGNRRTHFKLREPCNFEPCQRLCPVRVGRRTETRPCGQFCCAGFRVSDGVCVKTKH